MSEDQTVNIKQRIIGAVVLVSLGIILIPLLLNGGADNEQRISGANIPPMPTQLDANLPETPSPKKMPEAQTIVAYPEEQHEQPIKIAMPVKKELDKRTNVEKNTTVETVTTYETIKEETGKNSVTLPQYKKEIAPENNKIDKAYTLQVASFSQRSNAFALRDKMRKKQFKAYIESVNTSSGKIYRLRIGPYLKYDQILKIQNQVEKQFKISKTVIVKYQT